MYSFYKTFSKQKRYCYYHIDIKGNNDTVFVCGNIHVRAVTCMGTSAQRMFVCVAFIITT